MATGKGIESIRKLDIGEVAKVSGLPASTLRFYEEQGLIKSTGRNGLRRLFDADILDRLSLIALGRYAGFSLEELALMFSPDGRVRIERSRLSHKADELDATIEKLIAMRNGLRHAAKCPEPNHLECPKFRRLIRVAGQNQRKDRRRGRRRLRRGG
ncbi:MAG: helix-turn-helix domain-containing protein [Leptospirales bacterium]|jgi:DNA-binding transcriptional MerR regulator